MFDSEVTPQAQTSTDHTPSGPTASQAFEAFIRDRAFPCVAAKSTLARHHMQIMEVGDIRCPRDDTAIHDQLTAFASDFKANPELFQSFVVIFKTDALLSEPEFEQAMWQRIQALHRIDKERGYAYDSRVSSDATSSKFSLSFAEEAFYLIGMHPGASRPARRFSSPAIVFNAHDQFEQLRAQDRYETLRENIINRDIAFSGSANPMLSRFGDSTEAAQYSGRLVEADWTCPFKP
ncbi:MAG: guanitoxin biosynthesis heme-dependent pre-guanitoxin N-hydroxylase GntA [Asticcacaulis sp.]